MHFYANTLARATFGSAVQLGGRAVGAAHQVAGNAGRAAQRRLTAGRTPGVSLSASMGVRT
jgi:hypothetical protein